MKIYKNPFVSRECYFIKTGKARTGKMEATASEGYCVQFWNGKWEVKKAQYYDFSLRDEMPIVAESRTSIQSVIEKAILNAVLDLIHPTEKGRCRVMATCKECIHFSLCEYNTNISGDSRIYLCYDEGAEKCTFYKPAADVQEVKHGYWMFNKHPEPDEKSYFCPFCTIGESDSGKDNFCPNCGRKMDRKDDA